VGSKYNVVGAVYHNCLNNRMTKKVVQMHMLGTLQCTHADGGTSNIGKHKNKDCHP